MPVTITLAFSGAVNDTGSGDVSDADFATLLAAARAKYADRTYTDAEIIGLIRKEAIRWLETYPLRAVPRAPFRPMMQPPQPMLNGVPVAPITVIPQ